MEKEKLIKAFVAVLEDLGNSAAEKIKFEVEDQGFDTDVDSMRSELDFLETCQGLKKAMEDEDFEFGDFDYKWIRRDQGFKDTWKETVSVALEFEDIEDKDAVIEELVKIVYS